MLFPLKPIDAETRGLLDRERKIRDELLCARERLAARLSESPLGPDALAVAQTMESIERLLKG